jgi:hypothetical protein
MARVIGANPLGFWKVHNGIRPSGPPCSLDGSGCSSYHTIIMLDLGGLNELLQAFAPLFVEPSELLPPR